jgi:hypothetical protein
VNVIEAWQVARRYGEDIAQEAYVIARKYDRGDLAGYLLGIAKQLAARGFNDGQDVKVAHGQHLPGQQFPEHLSWSPGTDRRTPEQIAIARESIRAIDPRLVEALANDTYVSRARVRQLRGKAPGKAPK